MPGYKMVVFTNPVPGREEEYRSWYRDTHLADILSIDGFCGAQHFTLAGGVAGEQKYSHMAIYELDTDDGAAALKRLSQAAADGRIVVTGALDGDIYGALFEENGPQLTR